MNVTASIETYKPDPQLLHERIILVTGAGAGIGRAAAKAFASHGATVVLLGRTTSKLEAVYDEITASGNPQPAIYPLDLLKASPDNFWELADRLEQEFGRLNGLLHNAALLGALSPIERYDLQTWAQVMHVNLHGPVVLTQACLPLMRKSEDASIVFTSSGVGRTGRAYWGAYAVSKFAVEGLTQVLADELESHPGLRVNSINPGAVQTTMRATAFPAEDPNTLPRPEDIMASYLFLMGPDSRDVQGQAIDAQRK